MNPPTDETPSTNSIEPWIERARLLAEALPYIQRFHGKTLVIKYGGHAMVDSALKANVIRDVVLMESVGMRVVIVHGGGPEITQHMEKMGKVPEFANGLRVTDEETLLITEMVLVGKINRDIVNGINQAGGRAVGLSGKDAGLILARRYRPTGPDGESPAESDVRSLILKRSAVPHSRMATPAAKSPKTGACLNKWPEHPPERSTFLCSGWKSRMKWVSGVIAIWQAFWSTARWPTSPGSRWRRYCRVLLNVASSTTRSSSSRSIIVSVQAMAALTP